MEQYLENRRTEARALKRRYSIYAGLGFTGIAGLVVGAIYLSEQPPSTDTMPAVRFAHDYMGGQSHCLEGSAYDIWAGKKGKKSYTPPSFSYNEETGVLTLSPADGTHILKLTGFNQNEHTVSPVDVTSQDIFKAYGCEVQGY